MILSPWPVFYSILRLVVVCTSHACLLQIFIKNTNQILTKTMKKTHPKKTYFSMSISSRLGMHFGSFWEALGPRLGRFGGQNGVQERCNPWRKTIFLFALVIFVSRIRIFTNLGRLGERFGMVLGGVRGFSGVSGAIVGVFLWSLYRQCFPKDVLGAPGLVFGCISKDLGGSGALICGVKGWFWVAIWISFRDLKLHLGVDSKQRDFVKIVLPSRRNIIF